MAGCAGQSEALRSQLPVGACRVKVVEAAVEEQFAHRPPNDEHASTSTSEGSIRRR